MQSTLAMPNQALIPESLRQAIVAKAAKVSKKLWSLTWDVARAMFVPSDADRQIEEQRERARSYLMRSHLGGFQ